MHILLQALLVDYSDYVISEFQAQHLTVKQPILLEDIRVDLKAFLLFIATLLATSGIIYLIPQSLQHTLEQCWCCPAFAHGSCEVTIVAWHDSCSKSRCFLSVKVLRQNCRISGVWVLNLCITPIVQKIKKTQQNSCQYSVLWWIKLSTLEKAFLLVFFLASLWVSFTGDIQIYDDEGCCWTELALATALLDWLIDPSHLHQT